MKKTREDQDATVARLEKEMAKLKKKAIEEHKSLDNFQEAVEFTASKYFGEGFDFCKSQIDCLHPDLDIQDMRIDAQMHKEEEEEEEEKEKKEKEKEKEKGIKEDGKKGDTNPLSP